MLWENHQKQQNSQKQQTIEFGLDIPTSLDAPLTAGYKNGGVTWNTEYKLAFLTRILVRQSFLVQDKITNLPYGKAEASKICNTFCWIKILRMDFLRKKLTKFYVSKFFWTGVSTVLNEQGVSKNSAVHSLLLHGSWWRNIVNTKTPRGEVGKKIVMEKVQFRERAVV